MNILKKILSIMIVVVAVCAIAPVSYAQMPDDANLSAPSIQETPDVYSRARVQAILEEGEKTMEEGVVQKYQVVELEILNGAEKGKIITVNHGGLFAVDESLRVKEGDKVLIAKPANAAKENFYYIVDWYRLPRLYLIVLAFFALVIMVGAWRGFTAILGMAISAIIIFYGIVPRIMAGDDPVLVSLIGGILMLTLTLSISHGFNRRARVAAVAGMLTLAATTGLNYLVVWVARLTGTGSEEAYYLQLDSGNINARGLLLAGVLIAVIGVLDDVTTAQAAAVEEVSRANPALGFKELYRRGLSVGREHIAALVNTLLLAYIGASFPVVLLYLLHQTVPVWVMLNGNFLAEEIARTMVASSALVIAVPITTGLAALWLRHATTQKSN